MNELEEGDPIILSDEDWDLLIEELDNPDPPNEYLTELFRIYLRVKCDK